MLHGNPNLFASLLLILCVPLGIWLHSRYRAPLGTLLTVFGAAMFMPELLGWDPPVLPEFNKSSLGPLAAFIGLYFAAPQRIRNAKPFRGADRLFFLMVIGSFGTWLTNGDYVHHNGMVSPPVTLYDTISLTQRDLLTAYLPFLVGRAMYARARDLKTTMSFYVGAAFVYSLFCLYEVRMSPQLNYMFFNYQQHDFIQSMRGNGYRPLVFMSHGICVGRFMLGGVIAAAAMARFNQRSFGIPGKPMVWYLLLVLALCKSTGALVLAGVCFPLVMWTSAAVQFRAAWLIAGFVILFPTLRGADLFPDDKVVEWAKTLSEDRAQSLKDRFDQEESFIVKAKQRPLFGWGFYARNQADDPVTHEDMVIDGEWMIIYSSRGIVGYLGWYGLYLWPVINACRKWKRIRRPRDRSLLAALTLIAAVFTLDTVPNSAGSVPHFFICAALLGATETLLREQARRRAAPQPEPAADSLPPPVNEPQAVAT